MTDAMTLPDLRRRLRLAPQAGPGPQVSTARRRRCGCWFASPVERGVRRLEQLTPALLDDFLASRPRHAPAQLQPPARRRGLPASTGRSASELLAGFAAAPAGAASTAAARSRSSSTRPRPASSSTAAAGLPDNPRALGRGPTYRTIFALCYGLGLRVGEVCAAAARRCRPRTGSSLVVRGGKFGKSRLVPFGPRIGRPPRPSISTGADAGAHARRSAPAVHLRRGRRASTPARPVRCFTSLVPELAFPCRRTASHPAPAQPAPLLRRRAACSAGIARGSTRPTRLFQLSTFLGHVDPTSTAVYLTITPELFAEANRRFEAFAEPAWSRRRHAMISRRPLGPLVHSFFVDHLITVKGLRPASVRSYRDTIRLFLCFVARRQPTARSRACALDDLTFDRVVAFLQLPRSTSGTTTSAPATSGWPPLHTLFEYLATRGAGDARRSASGSRRSRSNAWRRRRRTSSTGRGRSRCCAALPAHGPARPARPRPAPVPLQHRRPVQEVGRPPRRAP